MHTTISRSLAFGTVTLALALTGCDVDSSGSADAAAHATAYESVAETYFAPVPVDDSVYVEDQVRLNDGRDVTCLRYKDKLLSCDWVNAGATGDAQ